VVTARSVTFDAAEAGTPAATWAADARLRSLPPLGLDGMSRLVVVAAHADDETLGAGGLIARAAARGIPIDVIVVTDGSASHPESPTHSAEDVAQVRAAEVRAAVARLAPAAEVVVLGVPDREVKASRAEVESRLSDLIRDATSVVAAPWRGDGHGDHREVGEAAASVAAAVGARFVEYPIWMWHWGTPDADAIPWPDLRALDLDEDAISRKRNALAEYRSQVVGLSSEAGDGPMLRSDFLEHFTGSREVFVEAAPPPHRDYFERLYTKSPDPWSFETRWYEKRKRAVTMASLPSPSYGSALEIGCSIGLLTAELAERCERLLALDISQTAVDAARARLGDHPGVTIEQADVALDFPTGRYDLVMLSEVGYYFDLDGLETLIDRIAAALADDGVLLACHWRHPVADYPLTGDQVHATIHERAGLGVIAKHVEDDFVLEVFARDTRSVAARTGLA
jgi:LmbE family N-acetylglucosaminyl deacetylase